MQVIDTTLSLQIAPNTSLPISEGAKNPSKKAQKLLPGDRRGRWLLLEQASSSPARWVCRCDCGTARIVAANALTAGRSRSCGCFRKSRPALDDPREAQLRLREQAYRSRAKRKGIDYTLTREEFRRLLKSPCFYQGELPRERQGRARRKQSGRYPAPLHLGGIDRLDSTKGYTPANCVPCCHVCNRLKSILSPERFAEKLWRLQLETAYELVQDGVLIYVL